jgi:predicted flap endonuclease-1-like 5' DNA nuclease
MRSKITNQQFDAEVIRVAEVADRARDLALQQVDRIRSFAGGAAVREIARLRARDGADAAETIATAGVMLAKGRALTRLREDRKAARLVTGVKRDTIAIGKIVTKGGRGAAGSRVVLTTDTGRAIGEALVDDTGLFRIDRNRDEFNKLVEGAKALVMVVQDAAGRDVHKTSLPIRKTGAVSVSVDVSARQIPGGPVGSSALSDVKGLGAARIARLTDAGILSVEDLAALKPEALAAVLHIGMTQAAALIKQAKQLMR